MQLNPTGVLIVISRQENVMEYQKDRMQNPKNPGQGRQDQQPGRSTGGDDQKPGQKRDQEGGRGGQR